MSLTHITMQEKELLGLILPKGVLEYFEIKESQRTEMELHVTLEEKNNPPIKEEDQRKKIISKGFKDITITDFPIRGRRSLLTFRRRYWQVEGSDKLLKRDIKLTAAGTQLEKEFADFLKEDGGRESGLAEFYRRVSADSDQGI
jgi:hypothetical protein